jgi:SDR family mycofactocin-dependent oxidoreductase
MIDPAPPAAGLRLANTVALVTGAAQGQGAAYARGLAQHGADVIVVDACRDDPVVSYPLGTRTGLDDVARSIESLGRRCTTVVADVRDAEAMRAAVDAAAQAHGRLDVVVVNAGICTSQSWDQVTAEVWDATIATNLTGAWNTCRVTAPHLQAAGGGSMILVSSAAGLRGLPFLIPYVASKHGMVGLMRALANELGPHRIRVNTIHPGAVDTAMGTGVHAEMAPMLDEHPEFASAFTPALPDSQARPDDLVPTIVYLASEESRYVTGCSLAVDAGTVNR